MYALLVSWQNSKDVLDWTQGYKPPDAAPSEYQTIPLNKIEDFGVHSDRYYPLDISYFKSSLDSYMLDLLWNKYWVNTLSSSPLLGTRDLRTGQIADIGEPVDNPSLTILPALWSHCVCTVVLTVVNWMLAAACMTTSHMPCPIVAQLKMHGLL